MRITHLGHACLLVEVADTRLLIDPGVFSPRAHEQRELDAVLVTHQHPDHLDADRLPALLDANPRARLITDPDSADLLHGKGIDVSSLAAGGTERIGGATVTGAGDLHALIHEEIPRIHNTGIRIAAAGEPTFYHPGDALDAEPGPIDVLAFPLSAPWARSRDMTGFLRRIGARDAIPIHDALLSPAGRNLYLSQAGTLGSKSTRIHDLSDGSPTEFSAGG